LSVPVISAHQNQQDSMFSPVAPKPNAGNSLVVGTSQSSSEESNSQNAQSQSVTTEYPQDTNYMEYLTCINNNRNPYIDRSGVSFPQSPDSSSGSSGSFPGNEPHPYEEPTQEIGSTQSASDLVPTQPSTQVTRENAEEPTQTDAPPADAPSENVPSSVNPVRPSQPIRSLA
jgi:hypothetical protein